MFDFSKLHVRPKHIDKVDLLARINHYEAFSFYFKSDVRMGKKYRNILRDDHDASCYFKMRENGVIFYDPAMGKCWDIINFVKDFYKIEYKDAIYRLAKDHTDGHFLDYAGVESHYDRPYAVTKTNYANIQFIPREFTDADIAYWSQYLITKEKLEGDNVFSVDKLYTFGKQRLKHESDLCFAYYYKKTDSCKIYQPYAPREEKWRSNTPFTVLDGMEDLKYKTETLIVAKSKKDKLVLLDNVWPDVVASQGENIRALSPEDEAYLFSRYQRIVIFFDPDATGLKEAAKFQGRPGYKCCTIDESFMREKVKDPSDYVSVYKEYNYLWTLVQKQVIRV